MLVSRTRFISRCHASILFPLFLVLLTITGARDAQSQEHDFDTELASSDGGAVECPGAFNATYSDGVFGSFYGRSRLTMAQRDQYHTYKFYTYEFSGKTLDERTGVRGTHHVNAAQCLTAQINAALGIPAFIALLHNAQFSSLACGDGGMGGGEHVASVSLSCGDSGGGGGGAPETRLTCYTVRIDHYWYYPDTGRVEYRYSDTYTWCEERQV